jgi:MvdD pre-ATP grasp domain
MILILTSPDDVHADRVEAYLQARGAIWRRFDPASFPTLATVTVERRRDGLQRVELATGAEVVDLTALAAVWYRRPGRPQADPAIPHASTRAAVSEMSQALLDDVWSLLDCKWVPAKPDVLASARKLVQLRAAARIGFDLPATVVTSRSDDFLRFYRDHEGNVVSKRIGGSSFDAADSEFCRYTEPVGTRDVGYAHSVRYCPLVFQEYVPKQLELRATVVGTKVFVVEIDSQATNHTRHDWRRYDHLRTPYRTHLLPGEVAERCVELTELLGLRFAALDLILTPQGRYVFVELNPNGQYLWTEYATGLPITEAVADLLMQARSNAST